MLEASGAAGCPDDSRAGPTGEGLGVVSFGGERVNEKVSIQDFFAPGGGLTFYVEGRTPTSFQVLEKAAWMTAAAPYGPELVIEVPLVETVPGADDASILSFRVKLGAAYKARQQDSVLSDPGAEMSEDRLSVEGGIQVHERGNRYDRRPSALSQTQGSRGCSR